MFIVKFRRIPEPKYNNSIKIGMQSSPKLFKITSLEVPTPSMGTEYEILEKTREKAPFISNINLFGFLQFSHPHTTLHQFPSILHRRYHAWMPCIKILEKKLEKRNYDT